MNLSLKSILGSCLLRTPLTLWPLWQGVADAEQRASAAIAAVHRRPVNLRRSEITSSESAVRGARLSALLSGGSEDAEVSAYSLLAPAQLQATARTFQRAPLQVLARLDALLGGSGTPLSGASRLSTLAQLIVGPAHPRAGLLPVLCTWNLKPVNFLAPAAAVSRAWRPG